MRISNVFNLPPTYYQAILPALIFIVLKKALLIFNQALFLIILFWRMKLIVRPRKYNLHYWKQWKKDKSA